MKPKTKTNYENPQHITTNVQFSLKTTFPATVGIKNTQTNDYQPTTPSIMEQNTEKQASTPLQKEQLATKEHNYHIIRTPAQKAVTCNG